MTTATGRKAPAPADYHGADGAPTCDYSIAGFAPCRRDPGHRGEHYDANGFAFMPDGVKPRPESADERGKRQLQEVYSALDKGPGGTTYIAWYGQLRAQEVPHAEAIHRTVVHFSL